MQGPVQYINITVPRDDWPRRPCDRPESFPLSDNPADHGLNAAEVACIEKAYEIRRREARAELERPSPFEFDWGLSGLEWPTSLRSWVSWILVVPVAFAFMGIVQGVAAPFQYVSHRRDVARKAARLGEELANLEGPPLLQPLAGKTLSDLWNVYGFERDRFVEAVGVELANAWLDRLYGEDARRALDLDAKLEAVNARRIRFRAESPQIGCVMWVPRLEQVVQELSKELPPYDWADVDRDPPVSVH